MNEICLNMLNFYYTMMSEYLGKKELSEDDVLNATDEQVLELFDVLNHEIIDMAKKKANDIITEDMDDLKVVPEEDEVNAMYNYHFNNEILLAYVDVFEAILVFATIYKGSADESVINSIINNNLASTLDRLLNDDDYKLKMTKIFIYYLVSRKEGYITGVEERETINANRYLWNLANNKGFDTLSDYIRIAILDFHKDMSEINSVEDTFKSIDKFILYNHRPKYYIQNGLDMSDADYAKIIKKYVIRTVLADAYIDLKLDEAEVLSYGNEVNPLQEEAIGYIEGLNDEEVMLPSDYNLRKVIYAHFINYNLELNINKMDDLNNLNEEEKERVLTLNPLSKFE